MILNISQNTMQTTSTFRMAGMASIKAFTTICQKQAGMSNQWHKERQENRGRVMLSQFDKVPTLMLCHLEIALRGLNARSVLSDRKADISSPPVASAIRLAKEIWKEKLKDLNQKLFKSIKIWLWKWLFCWDMCHGEIFLVVLLLLVHVRQKF